MLTPSSFLIILIQQKEMKSQGKKINEIEGKIFETIQEKSRQNTKGTAFLCITLNIREKTKWMGGKRGKSYHVFTL